MTNSKTLQMGVNHELLKQKMQEKNLTPAMIEKLKGISEQTVKNIVYGKTGNPGVDSLAPICDALDLTVDDVLFSKNKEIEAKVIQDNPSAYYLTQMYEFQMATLTQAHEVEMNNMREHYERELKSQENHYEKYITVTEAHYEKRLADKREHIDTILLDKKWFRLAAVWGVVAVLAIFLFIEFAMPGHGWFNFGEDKKGIAILGYLTALLIIVLCYFVFKKKKTQNKEIGHDI